MLSIESHLKATHNPTGQSILDDVVFDEDVGSEQISQNHVQIDLYLLGKHRVDLNAYQH